MDIVMGGETMKKKCSALFAALVLVCSLVLVGCSNKKKETESETEFSESAEKTQASSVVNIEEFGETFTNYKQAESFYVMRVGEALICRPGPAYGVLADDPEDLPDLKDGQIAYVTADIRDVVSSFGYVPSHTYHITNLISVKHMTYEEVLGSCDVPALDSGDENGFYWYKHKDTLYFIVLRDGVIAYTDEGRFTGYERPRYANELFDQFLKEVEERG